MPGKKLKKTALNIQRDSYLGEGKKNTSNTKNDEKLFTNQELYKKE